MKVFFVLFKVCLVEAAAVLAWHVTSGPCQVDGDCVTSPNYPQNYGNNQQCVIDTTAVEGHPIAGIDVKSFDTEKGFDKLIVNNVKHSGTNAAMLAGIVPRGVITWTSDSSVSSTGWKICPMEHQLLVQAVQLDSKKSARIEEKLQAQFNSEEHDLQQRQVTFKQQMKQEGRDISMSAGEDVDEEGQSVQQMAQTVKHLKEEVEQDVKREQDNRHTLAQHEEKLQEEIEIQGNDLEKQMSMVEMGGGLCGMLALVGLCVLILRHPEPAKMSAVTQPLLEEGWIPGALAPNTPPEINAAQVTIADLHPERDAFQEGTRTTPRAESLGSGSERTTAGDSSCRSIEVHPRQKVPMLAIQAAVRAARREGDSASTQLYEIAGQSFMEPVSSIHKVGSGPEDAAQLIRIACPGVLWQSISVQRLPNGARVRIQNGMPDGSDYEKDFHFSRAQGHFELFEDEVSYEDGVLTLVLKNVQSCWMKLARPEKRNPFMVTPRPCLEQDTPRAELYTMMDEDETSSLDTDHGRNAEEPCQDVLLAINTSSSIAGI